jgi:hypothetical protein
MKTLGRILIILAVFLLVMGITYVVVSANSSSTTAQAFVDGQRPPFAEGEMPDFEARGGGWMLGLVKNLGVTAIIVTLVALPKNFLRRKPLPVRAK